VALEDIRRAVLTETDDLGLRGVRIEEYNRLFRWYTPLHAAALNALHAIGVSWLAAYNLVQIAGAFLLIASIATFLHALFGMRGACYGAALAGLTYFVGHGVLWVVPWNMSMALMLLAASRIVRHGRHPGVTELLLILAAMLMHTIGRGFAALFLVASLGILGWPRRRRDGFAYIAGGMAIAAYSLLPRFVDRPDFSVPFVVSELAPSLIDVFIMNVGAIPRILSRSAVPVMAAAIWLHYRMSVATLLEPRSRRALLVFGVLFGALACWSLLHISPRIPGELLQRTWVPLGILLAGCAGHLLAQSAALPRHLRFGTYSFLALHVAIGCFAAARAAHMMSTKSNFEFDHRQVDLVSGRLCDSVLYDREEVMHLFLVHGAMRCGAVFANVLTGAGYKRAIDEARPPIGYVAAMNPMAFRQGWQPIPADRGLALRARQSASGDTLHLLIRATSDVARIEFVTEDGRVVWRSDAIRPGAHVWLGVPDSIELEHGVILRTGGGAGVELGGIRRGDTGGLRWPWDQRVTLNAERDGAIRVVTFETSEVFPPGMASLRVIADRGVSILAEVARP
jgi:hypothetical protein